MKLFEPSRLTLALHIRGKTQRDLAYHCNVTPQYISGLERGVKSPSFEWVEQLAEVLKFPTDFFYGSSIESIPEDALSFRARRSMKRTSKSAGQGIAEIVANIIDPDLQERFSIPKTDVLDLSSHVEGNSAEVAAEQLRSYWNLGYEPIKNMVHLLESKGVSVFWIRHDSPSLDAFSFWWENRPFVVLNSLKDSGERGRFDAAHELGHLVLHRYSNTIGSKLDEDQADSFASSFLMPRETFAKDCPDYPNLQLLYRLKPRWKVSVSAMVMRGSELGKFSEWQKRQAFKEIHALGMHKEEKMKLPREQSRVHDLVFAALKDQCVTPEKYCESLGVNIEDLGEIMPLLKNYLKQSDDIIYIRKKGPLKMIKGGGN